MKSILWGIIAGFALLAVYVVTMILLTGSRAVMAQQFASLWRLMIPLAVEFGVQVGIYMRLTAVMKEKSNGVEPGGHHRNGTLIFGQPIGNGAEKMTLTFQGIAGIAERSFAFSL